MQETIPSEETPSLPTEEPPAAAPSRNPIRKLYNWCLKWADSPSAVPALFGMSFVESSFFPIPPDVLLTALCFSEPKKWFRFAFWCSVASVLGGMFGYYIGIALWESVGQHIVAFYHGEATMKKIEVWYTEIGFFGILLAAITPIPYKVFTIASGVFQFAFGPFVLASIIGRSFRFFLVAGLIRIFGDKVRPFIEERLEIVMVVFGVLLVLGFVALKYLR